MQRHEIEAYLGDAFADLTGEQVDRLMAESDLIAALYPDPDDARREDAFTAAVQYTLGDVTIDAAGEAMIAARAEFARAHAVALQVAKMCADDGMPEAQAASRASIDRMRVLEARGKRKPRKR
jgi:hypothetical protein